MTTYESNANEQGVAMIEVLVSVLILAIMSLAVAQNLILSLRTAKFTEINHAASSLAISKMEELAAVNTADLNSSFSGTESAVSWPDLEISFTRATSVTVNSDNSRSVSITVSSNSTRIQTSVQFNSTFASWE